MVKKGKKIKGAGICILIMILLVSVFSLAAVETRAAAGVTLNKTAVAVGTGEKFQLKADKTVSWKVSDSKIAAVSSGGLVTGKKTGAVTVTATAKDGKKAQCRVYVKKPPNKVWLPMYSLKVGIGETITLTSSIPSDSGSASRVFRSSNKKVVSVLNTSWTGKFKALAEGTAYLTVRTYNGKEASCKITVKKATQYITLTKNNIDIEVGKTYTLGSGISQDSACSKRTYTSSDNSIVKMTRTDWVGTFKAVKQGVAYVTVRTYNGKTDKCRVNVVKTNWRSVYQSVIANTIRSNALFDSERSYYLLKDLDKDGIPELFISKINYNESRFTTVASFNRIYTAALNKPVMLYGENEFRSCGIYKDNSQIELRGHIGSNTTRVYKKSGNELKTVFSAVDTELSNNQTKGLPMYSIGSMSVTRTEYYDIVCKYWRKDRLFASIDGYPVTFPVSDANVK